MPAIREVSILPGCTLKPKAGLREIFEYFNGMSVDGDFLAVEANYRDGSDEVQVTLNPGRGEVWFEVYTDPDSKHVYWAVNHSDRLVDEGHEHTPYAALVSALDCALDALNGRLLFGLRKLL